MFVTRAGFGLRRVRLRVTRLRHECDAQTGNPSPAHRKTLSRRGDVK
jgi:hypothetical protein